MAETILGENLPTIDMDRAVGRIGLAGGRADRPVCFCGARNFHSCDERGELMPVSGDEETKKPWPGLFSCDGCGLIVEAATRLVVG